MENEDQLKALKVEVYDLNQELKGLQGFLQGLGKHLGLEGEDLSLNGIQNAIAGLTAEEVEV